MAYARSVGPTSCEARRSSSLPRAVLCLLLLASVSACTVRTNYQRPIAVAPDIWRVTGERLRDRSRPVEIVPGAHAVGDVLLRVPVWHSEMVRLVEPWRLPVSTFEEVQVLPAGTLLVRQQFLLTETWYINGQQSGTRTQLAGARDNPVEWCLASEALPAVCIFWETPVRTRAIPTPREGGSFGDPADTKGYAATMPVLALAPEAVLPQLTEVYRVYSIGRDGITVRVDTEGGATVEHGSILPMRFGRGRVEVHTVEGAMFSLFPVDVADPANAARAPAVRLVRVQPPGG